MLIIYYVLGIMLSILQKNISFNLPDNSEGKYYCYNSHLADEKILRLREV